MGLGLGEAAAAGTQLVGTGLQVWAQSRQNKKNREFAQHQYDQQRADAVADWERNNLYNSPEQQMVRLREAGLNPHLIYGGGGATSTASPVASSSFPTPQQETPNVGAMLTGPVNAYLETRRFAGQQRLLSAQTLKTIADTDTSKFNLEQKQLLADTNASLLKEILTGKKLENVRTEQETFNSNETHKANMAKLSEETKQIMQTVAHSQQTHNLEMLQRSSNLKKTAQEIINLRKDAIVKDLEAKVKNGEITRQAYEKETNSLDQMVRYAQLNALQGKDISSPEDAMQYIDRIIGLGTSFIK